MNGWPNEREVAVATAALAALDAQANDLREHLAKLREDLAEVQRDLGRSRAEQLHEANEKLVMAVLEADTIAEAAVSHLGRLAQTGQRDALTDTPHRTVMLGRVGAAVAIARQHGTRLALVMLDLDHFKAVNDALGRAGGDELLQQVAQRLASVVRRPDGVSRHDGDKFLILLAEVPLAWNAAAVGSKLLAAVATPSQIGGRVWRLSASLGIAIYPDDGADAATLIDHADAAMHAVKRIRPGGFVPPANTPIEGDRFQPAAAETPLRPAQRAAAAAGAQADNRDLREANEQLLMAALSAQESEAHARQLHRQQIKFMAMVAHELRNPLTPIRLAAGLLINRDDGSGTPLARLNVIIENQVAHMTRLIDDLLDGSRVSTGKLRLECTTVDLIGVIGRAADTCRPAMLAKHQQMTVTLPPGPLPFHGDPVRLAQIFNNLLENASKYTPDEGKIALAVTLQERAITVTVSDSGMGISNEGLTTIFGLFVQDTRALAHAQGGLGIGLAVVRDLVDAHGGTITARSAGRDRGSEFIVTLPRVDPATTAVPD